MMRPHQNAATGAFLAALAAAAFLPALWSGFVADDFRMLQTVDQVAGPLQPFTQNDLGQSGEGGHFYRPLWVLMNAGLFGIFGEEPLPFHVLNILLFAVLTLEVWALSRTLLPRAGAVAAAAVFAVYPRHAESVAWVSGNTDLLAVSLGLASLLCLSSSWSRGQSLAAATGFAVLAALAKEIGFVLPLLALGLALIDRDTGEPKWSGALVLAAALLPIAILRYEVIGGLGGYTENAVSPARIAGSAVSYGVAALSPHELGLLQRPWLLIVPLLAVLLAALGLRRLRATDHRPFAVCLLGSAWFGAAILPVLAEPLDLNTASGERLLLLPSVGLSISIGALLSPLLARRRFQAGAAVACALLAALCLNSARSWISAGELAEKAVASAVQLAPPRGSLVLVTFPDSYRNAHVFPNSLDIALARAGSGAATVATCTAVHVRDVKQGTVTVRRDGPGFRASAKGSALFDFPVLGDAALTRPACTVMAEARREALGLREGAAVRLTRESERLAFFDGEQFVAVSPSGGTEP